MTNEKFLNLTYRYGSYTHSQIEERIARLKRDEKLRNPENVWAICKQGEIDFLEALQRYMKDRRNIRRWQSGTIPSVVERSFSAMTFAGVISALDDATKGGK